MFVRQSKTIKIQKSIQTKVTLENNVSDNNCVYN